MKASEKKQIKEAMIKQFAKRLNPVKIKKSDVIIFESKTGVFGVRIKGHDQVMDRMSVCYTMRKQGYESVQIDRKRWGKPWMDNYAGIYHYK